MKHKFAAQYFINYNKLVIKTLTEILCGIYNNNVEEQGKKIYMQQTYPNRGYIRWVLGWVETRETSQIQFRHETYQLPVLFRPSS